MPSGGFSNQSFSGLIADLLAGLITKSLKQWLFVRKIAPYEKSIIAVGDIFPLFLAWGSKCNFAFVGTPKSDYSWRSGPGKSISDYYHLLKGSEWDPWEYSLMKSPLCKFVAVRDGLTAKGLKKHKVNVFAPGNPMMDSLKKEAHPSFLDNYRRVILLCGTRVPEALENFKRLVNASELIDSAHPIALLVALGNEPKVEKIEFILRELGFQKSMNSNHHFKSQATWIKNSRIIFLGPGKFSHWASWAELGLANAGTATEQLIGLGVPALSLPGKGPQFNKNFAKRQSRILGGAVIPCKNSYVLAKRMDVLLRNSALCNNLGKIGTRRMGKEGASLYLAQLIKKHLLE